MNKCPICNGKLKNIYIGIQMLLKQIGIGINLGNFTN